MNIVKQFAGNRTAAARSEPTMQPASRAPTPMSDDEIAQGYAFATKLRDEVQSLRERCSRLQADLNLQLMRVHDLEDERLILRHDMEAYRRYSVEVSTHLHTLIDVARRAHEASLVVGDQILAPDKQAAEIMEQTEREVRELSASDIAAKFAPPKE